MWRHPKMVARAFSPSAVSCVPALSVKKPVVAVTAASLFVESLMVVANALLYFAEDTDPSSGVR